MCNCIEEKEKSIMDLLKQKNPTKNYEELNDFIGTGLENKTYFIGSGKTVVYFPFKVYSTFTKVNGERSKRRAENMKILGQYCPFCGEKQLLSE